MDVLSDTISERHSQDHSRSGHRVLIVCHNPLFGHGVKSVLSRETELDIVALEQDTERAFSRVRELMPDVVILDWEDEARGVFSLMVRTWTALGIRVIGLSLSSNAMRIYQSENREVTCTADLVTAVLGQSHRQRLPEEAGATEDTLARRLLTPGDSE